MAVTESDIRAALSRVMDPELGKSLTELNMVKSIEVDGSTVNVVIYLTIAACPMRTTLVDNSVAAIKEVPGVTDVTVDTDVMSDEQRRALRTQVHKEENPFTKPNCRTRVYAVASGKGGVGKSSITANLGVLLAKRGLSVGIVDADIYGHSIPGMLASEEMPHAVDEMIIPPQAHGVKLISIAQFTEGNTPVIWRGPMLHRALTQFLTDVYWGELDILLLDLPPGTGDIALSVAQLLPNAEILVVTTPQAAAAEVAERAGAIAIKTHQKIAGVIENMGAMIMPDGSTMNVFGEGGGEIVANRLHTLTGAPVPLLGSIPLDPQLRVQGDEGVPVSISHPDSPTAKAFDAIADQLFVRKESLAGKQLL
ncbi:MAG: Mrp/NBP35 family ATP-binding protein [Corynebacterium sp.]|nr:Mrp/NBP35 family ATP-binding protein [Corynebacterium sp.]